jgi:chorismate synthase
MNTIGNIFRVTTFGESHGAALGCVIDGCPAGLVLDEGKLLKMIDRRKPGQSAITTDRKEADTPETLSGIYQGETTGTPIAIIVRNQNQRSEDYDQIALAPRRGHADETWKAKYQHVDNRGGGRSSGRETVSRVLAGWVAETLITHMFPELSIVAHVNSIGKLAIPADKKIHCSRAEVDANPTRCPDPQTAKEMESLLLAAKKNHESYGGSIIMQISGLPVGLGEPVFDKLHSRLAGALASIGTISSVNWIDFPVDLPGSQFHVAENSYGGVNGGISNGQAMAFKLEGKPIATIGEHAKKGRHDPCALPRIVPVAEAMAAIVLADIALISKTARI